MIGRTLLTVPLVILFSASVYAQQTPQQSTGQTPLSSPWSKSMSSGVRDLSEDKFKSAEDSFKDAIETVNDDVDDPRLPASLNNQGALYQREGRYNEAEPLHRRALELREEILGKEHPDVAQSLNNLATVYVEQRKYSQAIPLYERAIAIWKKTRGENHYKIGAALNNLASVAEVQGRHDEAQQLYSQSLALWEKNRGDNDLLYAQTLENYAGLLRRINDQAGAAQAASRASEIRAQARPPAIN